MRINNNCDIHGVQSKCDRVLCFNFREQAADWKFDLSLRVRIGISQRNLVLSSSWSTLTDKMKSKHKEIKKHSKKQFINIKTKILEMKGNTNCNFLWSPLHYYYENSLFCNTILIKTIWWISIIITHSTVTILISAIPFIYLFIRFIKI